LSIPAFIYSIPASYESYKDCGGELAYWRTSDGAEVDLVWKRGDKATAIEIKSAARWTKKFQRGLRALTEICPKLKTFGVYLGDHAEMFEQTPVLPLSQFLEQLWSQKIIG
jgi:hypothetical protein